MLCVLLLHHPHFNDAQCANSWKMRSEITPEVQREATGDLNALYQKSNKFPRGPWWAKPVEHQTVIRLNPVTSHLATSLNQLLSLKSLNAVTSACWIYIKHYCRQIRVSSGIRRVPLLFIFYLRYCYCKSVVYHLTCGRNSKNLAEPVAPYVAESSFEDTALVLAQLPTSDTVALCTASPLQEWPA